MAGTLEARTPDPSHYVDYEEYVDFQLEKTRSSIKLTDIFTTLTTLAVAVIGYLPSCLSSSINGFSTAGSGMSPACAC